MKLVGLDGTMRNLVEAEMRMLKAPCSKAVIEDTLTGTRIYVEDITGASRVSYVVDLKLKGSIR